MKRGGEMVQIERFCLIDRLLRDHLCVPFGTLMARLEVSRATVKRDLRDLRHRFNAPIVYDPSASGYRYEAPGNGPRFQLPGLWLSDVEIDELLAMYHQARSRPFRVGPHMKPLMSRLVAARARAYDPARVAPLNASTASTSPPGNARGRSSGGDGSDPPSFA